MSEVTKDPPIQKCHAAAPIARLSTKLQKTNLMLEVTKDPSPHSRKSLSRAHYSPLFKITKEQYDIGGDERFPLWRMSRCSAKQSRSLNRLRQQRDTSERKTSSSKRENQAAVAVLRKRHPWRRDNRSKKIDSVFCQLNFTYDGTRHQEYRTIKNWIKGFAPDLPNFKVK